MSESEDNNSTPKTPHPNEDGLPAPPSKRLCQPTLYQSLYGHLDEQPPPDPPPNATEAQMDEYANQMIAYALRYEISRKRNEALKRRIQSHLREMQAMHQTLLSTQELIASKFEEIVDFCCTAGCDRQELELLVSPQRQLPLLLRPPPNFQTESLQKMTSFLTNPTICSLTSSQSRELLEAADQAERTPMVRKAITAPGPRSPET